MHLQRQWWNGLVAAVLVGLVGVTTGAAACEQFLAFLGVREGRVRFQIIPQQDAFIAYVMLLNARDGGINGVKLAWEECETVFDVPRGVECYEHLKAKGASGVLTANTPLINALTERATQDQSPLFATGVGRFGRRGRAGVSLRLPRSDHLLESEHGQDPVNWTAGWRHGPAQGPENRPCLRR